MPHSLILRTVLIPAALGAAVFGSALVSAADLTVTSAKIDGGKLMISGTTQTGGMKVRLEGQVGSAFNTVSNYATRGFSFNLVYYSSDCVVALQRVNTNSTLGPAVSAVIANCGARGISPRGAWAPNANYLTNDVVTSDGSSWRAKRNNFNNPPPTSVIDWEKFASRGDNGTPGHDGATGPAGPEGPAGPAGAVGPEGPQGPVGAAGPEGSAGPAGAVGPEGSQGPVGTAGPEGSAGPAGAVGPEGSQGPVGVSGPEGPAGATGPGGPAGPAGAQGPAGPTGSQGVPGASGAQGPAGAAGPAAQVTRFSGFSETLVPLSWPASTTLCTVIAQVPSGSPRHATVDTNVAFRRSGLGEMGVGYYVTRDGVFPQDNRRFRGIDVTAQYFPTTYVWHDGPLTPGTTVIYRLVASKLGANPPDDVSSMGCEMTVTLD
jgi:hypothetical protein